MPYPGYGATYHFTDITEAVVSKLQDNQQALGLDAVYYGDQTLIPRTPVVCVEPGEHVRRLQSASLPPLVENTFDVMMMVYVQQITDIQNINRAGDQLLEQIADLFHQDWSLGGMLVFGMCERTNPGYVTRSGKLFRAGRINFSGMNKTFLINPDEVTFSQ